jgi:TackOD1 domain-containing protein
VTNLSNDQPSSSGTRFLVWGEQPEKYRALEEVNYTRDLEEPFDIVALLPGANVDLLMAQLFEQGDLLCPIADFNKQPCQRADFVGNSITFAEFQRASDELETISRNVAALPDFSTSGDKASLYTLAMAYSRQENLQAQWAPTSPQMVGYALLAGIPDYPAQLEDLANNGLLIRSTFDKLHSCNHCNSSRLNVREECSACRSSNLNEQNIVHHYSCAYQGPEQEFLRNNQLNCPKCKKELRHYAVDYDKPGSVFLCGDCNHSSSEPLVGFVCTDCGNHTDGDAIGSRSWYHYELSPDGIIALQTGILPYRGLQSAVSTTIGSVSRRDFINHLQAFERVASRYERPLGIISVRLLNTQSLQQEASSRQLSKTFALIGEIICQVLRTSDLVTATPDAVFMLLPETPQQGIDIAIDRLSSAIKEKVSLGEVNVEVSIEQHLLEDIEKLVESIA